MLKIVLLTISLSVVACGKQVPQFPEVWQCGYSWRFNKFRCKNTRTKAVENRLLSDPRMEGAQALPLDDYRQSEAWVATVKEIAMERCK